MKRLTVLILFLFSLQVFPVGAYEIEVDSFSESEVVLAVTNLQTVDIQVTNVQATVESETLSDTYTVNANVYTEGNKILISIDISPIFVDYSSEEMDSITVSGLIEVDGEKTEFGKRVSVRTQVRPQFAPAQESLSLMYWVLGLTIVFVVLILILFYKKPLSPKKSSSKAINKKQIKKKRFVKKKKAIKKAKKRV